MTIYAEDRPYWDTIVSPANSQGEITDLLERFGATTVFMMSGVAGGRAAWMIRFQWQERSYRFTFVPLTCREPNKINTYGKVRRTHADQARYQMGRIAVNFVKAILTAAEATPAALFGFLELPGARPGSGIPPTAAELNVNGLVAALPDIDLPPLLEDGKQ